MMLSLGGYKRFSTRDSLIRLYTVGMELIANISFELPKETAKSQRHNKIHSGILDL